MSEGVSELVSGILVFGLYICYYIVYNTIKVDCIFNTFSLILGYKYYISKWFEVLMPKIVPFLYGNGGNIIMVQVRTYHLSKYH